MILRQHYKAQKQNVVDQRLQPRNMCISQAAKLLLLCQPSMMGRTLKRRLTQTPEYQKAPQMKLNINGGIAAQPYQNLLAIIPESVMFPAMILAGAWAAKKMANFLEESELFIYEDDDD